MNHEELAGLIFIIGVIVALGVGYILVLIESEWSLVVGISIFVIFTTLAVVKLSKTTHNAYSLTADQIMANRKANYRNKAGRYKKGKLEEYSPRSFDFHSSYN